MSVDLIFNSSLLLKFPKFCLTKKLKLTIKWKLICIPDIHNTEMLPQQLILRWFWITLDSWAMKQIKIDWISKLELATLPWLSWEHWLRPSTESLQQETSSNWGKLQRLDKGFGSEESFATRTSCKCLQCLRTWWTEMCRSKTFQSRQPWWTPKINWNMKLWFWRN